MENNEVKHNRFLLEPKPDIEVMQDEPPLDEIQPSNQNLTNEQKLEYLSRLIQKVDQDLEANGISKKLVRKDESLMR